MLKQPHLLSDAGSLAFNSTGSTVKKSILYRLGYKKWLSNPGSKIIQTFPRGTLSTLRAVRLSSHLGIFRFSQSVDTLVDAHVKRFPHLKHDSRHWKQQMEEPLEEICTELLDKYNTKEFRLFVHLDEEPLISFVGEPLDAIEAPNRVVARLRNPEIQNEDKMKYAEGITLENFHEILLVDEEMKVKSGLDSIPFVLLQNGTVQMPSWVQEQDREQHTMLNLVMRICEESGISITFKDPLLSELENWEACALILNSRLDGFLPIDDLHLHEELNSERKSSRNFERNQFITYLQQNLVTEMEALCFRLVECERQESLLVHRPFEQIMNGGNPFTYRQSKYTLHPKPPSVRGKWQEAKP